MIEDAGLDLLYGIMIFLLDEHLAEVFEDKTTTA